MIGDSSRFHKCLSARQARPSGAKAPIFPALNGKAEALPYPKPIYEDRSKQFLAAGNLLGYPLARLARPQRSTDVGRRFFLPHGF